MEEINLSQIQRQIDLQVGEQLGQIKQKLNESLLNEVDWQLEEKVWQVSKKIWQKTGMDNNYQKMLDENGHLINSDDWNIRFAEYLAKEEGMVMTEAHWEVVNFLREYYEKYKITPAIKILLKAIAKRLGPEKGNAKYIYELFPVSPVAQATKIAGLPRPLGGCV